MPGFEERGSRWRMARRFALCFTTFAMTERYLGAVLPACNAAQQVVVYCDGGDCELSEFAAEFLRSSAGVANDKLFVFSGGLKEWERRQLPLEIGERKSGQFRTASK